MVFCGEYKGLVQKTTHQQCYTSTVLHNIQFTYNTLPLAKFTDEQYTTINQSIARCFDPKIFVNCLQVTCK